MVRVLTLRASPISVSRAARIRSTELSVSHRSPIDARTIEVSTPRLAKPIPAPYRDRVRRRAPCRCSVGVAVELSVCRTKREQGLGGTSAFVWRSRMRAMSRKSAAKLGGRVDRRFFEMQRRLRHAVNIYVLEQRVGSLLISGGVCDEGVHHKVAVVVCISA